MLKISCPTPLLGRPDHLLCFLLLVVLCNPAVASASEGGNVGVAPVSVRDGRLFDPGVQRTTLAASAPVELGRLSGWIGDWDLVHELHRGDEVLTATGRARITYMNRGHAVLERTRIVDFDGAGHDMATLAFFDITPQGVWSVGEGNSWAESISLWSGGWSGEDSGSTNLVVHDAIRPGGGPVLLLLRRTYSTEGQDRLEMRLERSADLGTTWQPVLRRVYSRHQPTGETTSDFFPVRSDVGVAAPNRPEEAAQFDFLLGEFDAQHWQRAPNSPARNWRADATAVFALDGKAILEFGSFDTDPSLPDAATSILRLYNTSMRRWESLFLPNRSHRPLYFGGVREDDRIVLHLFDAQTGPGSVFQWIFFDIRADAYRWKGLGSSDRGQTYGLSWGIDFVRKGAVVDLAEVREVQTPSADGTMLFGDHYRAPMPAATTVVLFHQAGGDARGEYGEIASRLLAEGFEVFAWDVRGGGDRFGAKNRTIAQLDVPFEGTYCDAYPDLEAALRRSFEQGSGGPLFVVGSSYSAALAVRLAAEHGRLLAGTAAFSPASGQMGDCAVERWLPKIGGTPILVFRPVSELENESVAAQKQLLEAGSIEVFVGPGKHGASMLNARRSGEVEETWRRLRDFFADPGPQEAVEKP